MIDLSLFVVHGNTWTRAEVPQGIKTARDLVSYIQRGGRISARWMLLPDRRRVSGCGVLGSDHPPFGEIPGFTVLARLEN